MFSITITVLDLLSIWSVFKSSLLLKPFPLTLLLVICVVSVVGQEMSFEEKRTKIISKKTDVESIDGATVVAYVPPELCKKGADLKYVPSARKVPTTNYKLQHVVKGSAVGDFKATVMHHKAVNRSIDDILPVVEENFALRHSGGFSWFALEVTPTKGTSDHTLELSKVREVCVLRREGSLQSKGLSEDAIASIMKAREKAAESDDLLAMFDTEEDNLYRDEELEGVVKPASKDEVDGDEDEPKSDADSDRADEEEDDDRAAGSKTKRQDVDGEEEDRPGEPSAKKSRTEGDNSAAMPPPINSPPPPHDLMDKCRALCRSQQGMSMGKDKAVKKAIFNVAEFNRWKSEPNIELRQEWFRIAFAHGLKCLQQLGCSFDGDNVLFP